MVSLLRKRKKSNRYPPQPRESWQPHVGLTQLEKEVQALSQQMRGLRLLGLEAHRLDSKMKKTRQRMVDRVCILSHHLTS